MKRFASFLLAIFGAVSVIAQQPPVAQLKTQTSLVFVDAVVTDASGRPLRGLTARDFEVTENGVPQEITSVTYAPPLVRHDPRQQPRGAFSNRDVLPHEGAMTLVLLDCINTEWEDQV